MREMNWLRLMLFLLMLFFVSNAIYNTLSISRMDDEELKQYIQDELHPQKKRVSRSYNLLKETLYNCFGRYGIVFYYWLVAIFCFIMWKIEHIVSESHTKKQKAQEEAELAKHRKQFNKHRKKKE